MRLARKSLSLAAAVVISMGLMSPIAQAQAERIVAPQDQEAYVQEFYQDGDRTPVVNGSGGLTDAEVDAFHQAVRDAEQAGPLNDEIIAGEMLSDKIMLPPQVDKATSDEAEVAVANQQAQLQTFATTDASCHRFIFTIYDVCGAILERYNQLGGLLSILLDPIGPQIQNPDGVGFHQQFRNGFIFWHPDTGAHAITARNAEVYQRNGWSAGWMGYPLGGEVPVSGSNPIDGELNGWVQVFQGGRIYRTPILEGFQVASINGLILDKWLALGGANSALGLPIADEAIASDGIGRFSIFQHGVIYWHPAHGAWELTGIVGEVWKMRGGIDSQWGYPIAAPILDSETPVEIAQEFSNGRLDIGELIVNAGLTSIQGKEINNLILEYFEYKGLEFPAISSSLMTTSKDPSQIIMTPFRASLCTLKDSSQPNFAGITIPNTYDYWGCLNVEDRPDPSAYGRHDYCTNSADEFPNPLGTNAEFSGACARHDMCMDAMDSAGTGYGPCHPVFYDQLFTICVENYGPWNPVRTACVDTAKTYWVAVKYSHYREN